MSEDQLKAKEKWLERDRLKPAIEKAGGLCLKLFSPWFTGLPDRMILMPGGRITFVEVKTTGKKLQPRQIYVKAQLEKLGFRVFKVDSEESLIIALYHITGKI